jgi:hypothetical protein
MAWIQTIPFDQADTALAQALAAAGRLLPPEYASDPEDDGSRGIVATHSLIPEALRHAFSTFGVLLSPELPLTRRQHEMITTRVSAVNRCHY